MLNNTDALKLSYEVLKRYKQKSEQSKKLKWYLFYLMVVELEVALVVAVVSHQSPPSYTISIAVFSTKADSSCELAVCEIHCPLVLHLHSRKKHSRRVRT